MLWSLGLAAATGVLAVLVQGGDLVWRLVGTGLTTALACALMIPASLLIDRGNMRWAGLLGMGAIIFEFVLAMSLIWEIAQPLLAPTLSVDIKVILTMMFVGLAALLAMTCAAPLRIPPHALAAKTAIGFLVVSLAGYMMAIWFSDFPQGTGEEWWLTASALLVLGLLVTPSLAGLSAETPRVWRWAGITAGVVACAMWLTNIWHPVGSPLGTVVFCATMTLSGVAAHANFCLFSARLSEGQRWVRRATIAAAAAAGLVTVAFVAGDQFPGVLPVPSDFISRVIQAAGIVAACGTLALLVLARINRRVDVEPDAAELAQITLICPRCRRKQSLPVGGAACAACGLRIAIRVEEPRCATCGYLLHGLTSDRCPECGTFVQAPALNMN
jgi:hypothetical protein